MKQFLHVDLPCHENWDAMAQVRDGRFCGSCTQRVIDFTQLTDGEILEAIRNAGGNCCGRFTTMQLDRPLEVHSAHRAPFRMPVLTAAAFTSFLLVQALPEAHAQQQHASNVTVSQAQDTAAPANISHTEGPYMMGKIAPYRVLAGVVVNERGKPLHGITINVEGQHAPGSSDASGHFYVQLPLSVTTDQPLHLRLSDDHRHVQHVTVTLRRAGDDLQLRFRNTKAN
ncbi:hypothetical protein DCC81_01040 [Chitinophaga parva]|uniref:Carboxypeptidase regulatory-like domain-containing protein n=1 Tax=Chitinophaga parva TaxID=2169414 RepID=A0A2T7BKC7_9BACT|nr:hypothetical protein [Chitinophaga parva]PUZ28099.1 hypothetical protein DCC81_01040 [Chitinophaga parva]